jgi:hypothetical protein
MSCRSTHNWSSVNLDYYNKYYSRRCSTYKLDRTIVTVGAPRMLAISTSPPSAGVSSRTSAAIASSAVTAAGAAPSCALVATTSSTAVATGSVLPWGAGGLALQLRQELFNSGGWATTPSRLPYCVPLAFVALINGLRWWHLLHTRKTTHQQVYSHDGYSTTLVKTSYLLRRGL